MIRAASRAGLLALAVGCPTLASAAPVTSAVTPSKVPDVTLAAPPTVGRTLPGTVGAPSPGPSDVPEVLRGMPFLDPDFSDTHDGARPGKLFEVRRDRRKAVENEDIRLPTTTPDEDEPSEESPREEVPKFGKPMAYEVDFEFYDIQSQRTFRYRVAREELARASRAVSLDLQDNGGPVRPGDDETEWREGEVDKSWSNGIDSRIRRGTQDGWSDTNWVYQNLADYGGCSATVLSASSTRMVVLTAAHCIYGSGGVFVYSDIRPRRNGGTSPTWGSWEPYGFGYYPAFLDNDCEDNWDGSDCIKHDIALVVAYPKSGAKPPSGMGWGYRPKSFLDSHSKYRRGYPGCGYSHSPSPCSTNYLYGDGLLSVGSFSALDGDNWNRRIRFSSDVNPGDSGSGLYYYRDGHPYVFGVTSAEDTCYDKCTSVRPNHSRRITPQWFDFINSVVF